MTRVSTYGVAERIPDTLSILSFTTGGFLRPMNPFDSTRMSALVPRMRSSRSVRNPSMTDMITIRRATPLATVRSAAKVMNRAVRYLRAMNHWNIELPSEAGDRRVRPGSSQLYPGASLLARFHRLLDEVDAGAPIIDVGVLRPIAVEGFLVQVGPHVGLEGAVEPRERVVECLGMAGGDGRLGHQVGGQVLEETVVRLERAAPVNEVGLSRHVDGHALRVLLHPAQAALGAVHLQPQVVLVADGDLARADHAPGPVGELEVDGEVVIELPAGDEFLQVRLEPLHLQPGDEA